MTGTDDKRQYIRWCVVRVAPETFDLEEVLGYLIYRSQAVALAQKLYWSGDKCVAIVDEHTMNAIEEEKSAGICGCQTEKDMKEDEVGTYWACPNCD